MQFAASEREWRVETLAARTDLLVELAAQSSAFSQQVASKQCRIYPVETSTGLFANLARPQRVNGIFMLIIGIIWSLARESLVLFLYSFFLRFKTIRRACKFIIAKLIADYSIGFFCTSCCKKLSGAISIQSEIACWYELNLVYHIEKCKWTCIPITITNYVLISMLM